MYGPAPVLRRGYGWLQTDGPGVCSQVIVANLPSCGVLVRPEARGDDGLLDLVLFRGRSRLDLARYAAVALTGRARQFDVEIVHARQIRLEAEGPVPLHLDGDEAGELPVVVGVKPMALNLLVPPTPSAS